MNRLARGAALLVLLWSEPALAQGINTNVALPVAEGEGIFRSQLRARWATDDPTPADREVATLVAPQTLVYGATPRMTAFATLPILARRRDEVLSSSSRTTPAMGDVVLLSRYTVLLDDYAPLSTRRVALLAGLKLPVGAERFGTPTFDPRLGAVGTWAHNRHELDADVLYTLSTKRQGFTAGDRFRYDVAYRYRLWPKRFGKRLVQINGLLELNGLWSDRNEDHGSTRRNSGGHILFLSPGFQYVAKSWILEASLQLPISQNLNGSQVETDFVGVLSVRVPFEVHD